MKDIVEVESLSGIMINVSVPKLCLPEVSYTIECLLGEFLGLDYNIFPNQESEDFILNVESDKQIVIKNHFFNSDDIEILYQPKNIPSAIHKGNVKLNNREYSIHSLYGDSNVDDLSDGFVLECDIVSSTYFMLSRWEEYVLSERDQHDRFLFSNALSVKTEFYHIPIINQYVELLYALLLEIGLKQQRKKRKVDITISHDIDYITKWPNLKSLINVVVSTIKSKSIIDAFKATLSFMFSKLGLIKDPYDTLVYLSKFAQRRNYNSIFYFMVNKTNHKYDKIDYNLNSTRMNSLISTLQKYGSDIGLHPSYETYSSQNTLKSEISTINRQLKIDVQRSRQHYLRIQIPFTFRYLRRLGIREDSTLLYGTMIGFRNGVCYKFKLFDFLERKKLDIYQLPLVFMENHHLSKPISSVKKKLSEVMNYVNKYNGEVSLLWHNSNLDSRRKRRMFKSLMDQLIVEST